MNADCPTCKLVWDEFSDATKAHFAILARLQVAQTERNDTVVARLEPLTAAAATLRCETRLAFKDHEASHLSGTPLAIIFRDG